MSGKKLNSRWYVLNLKKKKKNCYGEFFLRWPESSLLFFSPENSWVFQNLDLYKEKFKQLDMLVTIRLL